MNEKPGLSAQSDDVGRARAIVVFSLIGVWFLTSMAGASENTSWEHHPFAGPFIILKESRSMADLIVTGLIGLAIGAPAIHWMQTGRTWSAIAAIVAAGVSVCLSIFAAVTAGC